jgi:MYXO-CTERM domain-containing protein
LDLSPQTLTGGCALRADVEPAGAIALVVLLALLVLRRLQPR